MVEPGHRRRTDCRLCGSARLRCVLPLEPSPIADAYVPRERLSEPQPRFPMDLYQCGECGHAQLCDVVSPEMLFRDYLYQTSDSPGLVEHFRKQVDALATRFAPPAGALAVDIGSNDGTVLRLWRERGLRVCGVDPAERIARNATAEGLPTRCAYFTSSLGRELRTELGPAAVVTANNVFAHSDALPDILDGVRALLDAAGVFVFEVSYLVDIVEKRLFDTIYHEHLCYHSVGPLQKFFRAHGMEIFEVERIAAKGGSIRVFAQHAGGPQRVAPRVGELLAAERAMALDAGAPFVELARDLERNKAALHAELNAIRAAGGTVAGFGASATVTTLLTHFELAPLLDYLVDDNPKRHGLFSPHFHLPVRSSQVLHETPPGCVVILAWQYSNPIIARHRGFACDGRYFLLPMPEVKRVA